MEPDREQVAAVAEALQHAWDEFCADTGCFPDCFEWRDGKLYADFQIGVFARQVTTWLDPLVNLAALSDDELVGNTGQVVKRVTAGWECLVPWDKFPQHHRVEDHQTNCGIHVVHSVNCERRCLDATPLVRLVPVGGEEE